MRLNKSGVSYSSIVGIGEKIAEMEEYKGEYLPLQRGVNMVVQPDLSNIKLDLNHPVIQNYPLNSGHLGARIEINDLYFKGLADTENIIITGGGMQALDLIITMLDVPAIHCEKYHWGSYDKIIEINGKTIGLYGGPEETGEGNVVIICDPSNPTGIKKGDQELFNEIKELNDRGVVVIFDCPYRKLFVTPQEDWVTPRLLELENVIVCESFSKWMGLPGLRTGFIHCQDEEFNEELRKRVLYLNNGISSFSQVLLHELLFTPEGQYAIEEFQSTTLDNIGENVIWLHQKGYLAKEIYGEDKAPNGMFAIVDFTEEYLLENKIGSVSLDKFTLRTNKEAVKHLSRICVSVPHDRFVSYFEKLS